MTDCYVICSALQGEAMKPIVPIVASGVLALSAIGVTTAMSQDASEPIRTVLPDKPAGKHTLAREVGKPLRARSLKSSDQRRGPRGPGRRKRGQWKRCH